MKCCYLSTELSVYLKKLQSFKESGSYNIRSKTNNSVKNRASVWLSFKTARLGWYEFSHIAESSVRNDYLVDYVRNFVLKDYQKYM